jgi:hypothetical protein
MFGSPKLAPFRPFSSDALVWGPWFYFSKFWCCTRNLKIQFLESNVCFWTYLAEFRKSTVEHVEHAKVGRRFLSVVARFEPSFLYWASHLTHIDTSADLLNDNKGLKIKDFPKCTVYKAVYKLAGIFRWLCLFECLSATLNRLPC